MAFSSFVALALLAATAVSGTPLEARQATTCHPNAQGAGVSIVNTGNPSLEWGVASANVNARVISSSFRGLAQPDWHVQQNGQSDPSYVIRDVNNNNLAVTFVNAGDIELQTASNSGNAGTQLWDITCGTCSPNALTGPGVAVGDACTIQLQGTNLCAEIGSDASAPLTLEICNGSARQSFRIQT
ncbi:hypothetical protein K435DRAFT_960949 [Dendrothele bispora CBS 962.96]|uniref:Ricin B lectin domain-containing protein n=1 Tax=Dendrothele bispora (strain CBS 962.96) TaxID=1314807 RepID=A0A4S8MSP7_DENBC|nr:hypothetical protein K435DRAFT_960949 [Dendrothele bispora CBS 962.96]